MFAPAHFSVAGRGARRHGGPPGSRRGHQLRAGPRAQVGLLWLLNNLLLSNVLTPAPAEIIRLYALRFKIEVSFKQALHSVGSWTYHFWMRTVRSPHCPSEFVVACALRHSLPEFLAASPQGASFELFLRHRLDLQRIEGTCLAAQPLHLFTNPALSSFELKISKAPAP